MLSTAANALNSHAFSYLGKNSPELEPWRILYEVRQLICRKKIGITTSVKERASGKNPDPKVTAERHLR